LDGTNHINFHNPQDCRADSLTGGREYYFHAVPEVPGLTVTITEDPGPRTAPFYWTAPQSGTFHFTYPVSVQSPTLNEVIARAADRPAAAVLAGGDVAIPDGHLYMRAEDGNLCGLKLIGPDTNGRYSLSIVPENH
jgi:hypothetical protein